MCPPAKASTDSSEDGADSPSKDRGCAVQLVWELPMGAFHLQFLGVGMCGLWVAERPGCFDLSLLSVGFRQESMPSSFAQK